MGTYSLAKAGFMALEGITRDREKSRSGATNRTRAHVHPNSRLAGTFEDDFFYSYAKGEPDLLYKRGVALMKRKNAIRRLARAEGRQLTADEQVATLLTRATLSVLEALTTLARTCAGKIFPTWEWIEANSGVSRASVGRALSALVQMGLLEKQRRCIKIDPPRDRPRARHAQTSSVYRMRFPNRLVRFLPHYLRPAPLPDDVLQRHVDQIEEIEVMRLWRKPRQIVADDIDDEPLRKVLASLGAAIEKQESQKNGQPLTESFTLSTCRVGLAGQHPNA